MQFSTQAKSYGNPQGSVISSISGSIQGTSTNGNNQTQSSLSYKITQRKQVQTKRTSLIDNPKNDQLFGSFPQLVISRVDSAERTEKKNVSQQNIPTGGNMNHLTTSLIAKTNRGDAKITSTSMDKSSNYYAGPRQYISSNQSDTNRASYRMNYATYKRDTNLAPNYSNGGNQQDGSDNQGNQRPSYKAIGKYMTLEKMDEAISPHMVSSVYSREERSRDGSSSEKNQRIYQSTRSRNKDDEGEKAYDLYASRHPEQSIRRSTIQISKAISSNAITQLQKQNYNQDQKIKKLEKEIGQFKNSLKKWDQIKYRYTMDLESKSRQIFDLQRANKRLTEEVQGIRTYRTMDTVEQVIIVKLKQQIMQLNKKIIEMQADYYKNQKSLLEKASKKQIKIEQQNDKETIKKLQQSSFMSKKQIELLSVELQKEKEKSWKLQQQKQQYLAEKSINKQNYQKQISTLKKDMNGLRQQTYKHLETIRQKQISLEETKNSSQHEIRKITQNLTRQVQQQKRLVETQANSKSSEVQKLTQQLATKQKMFQQKLAEQKTQFEAQMNQKLASKQQQSKNILNNQIKNLESQMNNKAAAEIQRLSALLIEKDRVLEQRLAEERQNFDRQLSERLNQKQQQYRTTLNNQMRMYEAKVIEQGKTEKLKQSENKQLLDRLRQQKQQSEAQLKKKIAQVEQGLKAANSRLVQKQQQIKTIQSNDKNIQEVSAQYVAQIENLRKALFDSQNYIRDVQNQNQNIKAGIRERDIQIEHLRVDNMRILEDINKEVNQKSKWKQQQSFIIENQVKAKLQEQFRQKQRQLETRAASLNSQQQTIKQLKVKVEQEQQQQAVRLQAEIKEKQQKVQAQLKDKQQKSIKELETTKIKLSEEVKKLSDQSKKLNDQVKKVQVNLGTLNKQIATANSKKMQVESEINLKHRQVKQIQVQIIQIKRDLQGKLTEVAQVQSQKRNLAAEAQKIKEAEEKEKVVSKQYQTKYNAALSELNTLKLQYSKLEQKSRQTQIEFARASENINMWKLKSQNSENSLNKAKADLSAFQKEREQFKLKLKDAQQNKSKGQIAKKYEQLYPEYQLIKQKLKLKQQQSMSRQSAFLKIRQATDSGETKASALHKQLRMITNKVDETESKFKALLAKVELEQYKYKQLYDKLVKDTQVYMTFIKKLQEDNELIAQKYWKVRKLVKKEKITDEHDLLEKKDESEFKKFLQLQILSHFNKMIVPACQAKILQKVSQCQTNIALKQKKLARIKGMAEQIKRKGQAQRARSKN